MRASSTTTTLSELQALQEQVLELDGVVEASPLIPSEDGEAAQFVALLDSSGDSGEVPDIVEALRATVTDALADSDLQAAVTGPAGFSADIVEAFGGIDGLLLLVALGAVFVILVIVYRSPLLPVLVLFTSVAALCLAILIVFELAKAGILTLSGQTQGILFILVVGAATDYGLLYTARFREALGQVDSRWEATKRALKGAVEPIVASGGTVIAGLLCLLLSDLVSNQQLGPVAAIGIATSILAGAHAAARAAAGLRPGRVLARRTDARAPAHEGGRQGPVGRVSRGSSTGAPAPCGSRRRSCCGIGALGVTQLQANGVPSSDFVVGESEARDGQALLSAHFPGGSGTPTQVLTPEADVDEVSDALLELEGVEGVAVVSEDSPSGTIPLPVDPRSPFAAATPTVVDGQVLLQATLVDAPDSDEAQDVVREMRDTVHAIDPEVAVGGTTATAIDTNDASDRDRALIIPIVLLVISIILMLLLRSFVAALLLLATTVLSYYTALGVGAVILGWMGIAAMDPAVPLFAFVFLVALGRRLQHLPHDPGARGGRQARPPRGRAARPARDGRRHHVGGRGARGDLRGARRHPGAVPAAAGDHRGARRADRHDAGALAAGAGARARDRAEDLVAVEARARAALGRCRAEARAGARRGVGSGCWEGPGRESRPFLVGLRTCKIPYDRITVI